MSGPVAGGTGTGLPAGGVEVAAVEVAAVEVADVEVLDAGAWHALRDAHVQRAESLMTGVRERRRSGQKHPVEDFMFDYYNLRPGQVATWFPGIGRRLRDAAEIAAMRHHRMVDGLVEVDVDAVAAKRAETLQWVRTLLAATASRPANVGCFGMHEWAMVYGLRPDQTRHAYLPLRLSPDEVREVVDGVGLRCSHFDAFRFFTPEAAPRNPLQLTRADQVHTDQPGCLHVTMDLYKWAGKLVPLTPPELLLDCFELARDVRELDMRASAYDLADWGYEAVRVETAEGRSQYARMQRGFAERGAVLRQRLLDALDRVERLRDAP